jgi:hypothetical protein
MKYLFLFMATISITACSFETSQELSDIKQMIVKLDSAKNIYKSIDWKYYKELNSKINKNMKFISDNIDAVTVADKDFIKYTGPYSTTGKIINRVFRKKIKKIDFEIDFSAKQLQNLSNDVKKQLITDSDSLSFYITQEKDALDNLLNKISDVKNILEVQKKAYEKTHTKVDSLIATIKQN